MKGFMLVLFMVSQVGLNGTNDGSALVGKWKAERIRLDCEKKKKASYVLTQVMAGWMLTKFDIKDDGSLIHYNSESSIAGTWKPTDKVGEYEINLNGDTPTNDIYLELVNDSTLVYHLSFDEGYSVELFYKKRLK